MDCLAEGVATHMMEVLKELSAAATGMFSLGGGRPALGGLLVVVPLTTPAVGGALTCCLGVGAFLDCLGGVVSLLRSSCLDRFEDSALVSVLIGLGSKLCVTLKACWRLQPVSMALRSALRQHQYHNPQGQQT